MEQQDGNTQFAELTVFVVLDIRNPVWARADHSIIEAEVLFEVYENTLGWLPFSCSASDTGHGAYVWDQVVTQGNYGTIGPYVPPPPMPYSLSVSDMWDRMTEQEAEDFDAAVSVAPPLKSRKAFQSASTLDSASALFTWVKNVLLTVTTAARADVIMG